jgi:hypothetical protein
VSTAADDERKTDAKKNFEKNLDEIVAFIRRMRVSDSNVPKATKVLLRTLEKEMRTLEKEVALAPKVSLKRHQLRLNRIQRKTDAFKAAADDYRVFTRAAFRWLTVMLVTFLEAYLEEGLVSVAAKNPDLVKDADILKNRVFELDSIEDLRNWAHSVLRRPGGLRHGERICANWEPRSLRTIRLYSISGIQETSSFTGSALRAPRTRKTMRTWDPRLVKR